MQKKTKHKPNNSVDTLFRLVLFTKTYRIETSMPIDTVIENLQSMSGDWQTGLRQRQISVTVEPIYDQYVVNMDVCYNNTAQIRSNMTVFTDADGQSVIVGAVHLSEWIALLLFVSVIITAFIITSGPPTSDIIRHLFSFILFSSVPLYFLISLLVVRNKFLRRIQDATASLNTTQSAHSLEQSQSLENSVDLYRDASNTRSQAQP